MNNNHDPLGEQLRLDAIADRPAFSASLHERILERIDQERFTLKQGPRTTWRRLAVAAAIVLVIGGGVTWMVHRETAAIPSVQLVTSNRSNKTVTVDLRGLLYAQFSPTGLTVQSPLGGGSFSSSPRPAEEAPTEPAVVPASPEWLLAQLQAPTSSAKLALAEVIPQHVRELTGLSGQR